jgi:hypothetical protein
MGYGMDARGSIPDVDKRFISVPQLPDWLLGPPSLLSNWFPGGRGVAKRPGREADHSRPPSAEVKLGGDIPPLSHTSSWHSA